MAVVTLNLVYPTDVVDLINDNKNQDFFILS